MEYLIYNVRYKTTFEKNLTSVISAKDMERAKSTLEEYLKAIHSDKGFEPEFVINTGFYSNREGIILFR